MARAHFSNLNARIRIFGIEEPLSICKEPRQRGGNETDLNRFALNLMMTFESFRHEFYHAQKITIMRQCRFTILCDIEAVCFSSEQIDT